MEILVPVSAIFALAIGTTRYARVDASLRAFLMVARATLSSRTCLDVSRYSAGLSPGAASKAREERELHLGRLMAGACSAVVRGEEIRSVTIVTNRPLTYREYARMREFAAAFQVAMTTDATGTIRVRRQDGRDVSRMRATVR